MSKSEAMTDASGVDPSGKRSGGNGGCFGHLSRISVIALHAFTQLVRMKVFYFLAVFAVIILASNLFDLPQHAGPESVGASVLRSIKSWSIGTMHLFSVVLGVVATALLLPKDIEDRTLYTILAKPVPRVDYLIGKLFGVLLLIFVSLAIMDVLMTVVLQVRTGMVMEDALALGQAMGYSVKDLESVATEVSAQGPNWSLQGAVLAVFFRSAIIAALALLISTFSTSTLFTAVISFLVYFIGHFQADARTAFLDQSGDGEGPVGRMISLLISLVLPDFQVFGVIDSVIEGQAMVLVSIAKLGLLAFFYVVLYVLASWLIFAEKEF